MSKKSDTNTSVIVNAQYVKDLSFENPKAPYSFLGSEKSELDILFDVSANNIQEETYEVILSIQVKALVKEDIQYLIDLKYAGVFTLNKCISNEEREKIIFIQCANIIFPYARRVVSDISRDGGYLPLYLLPVDFKSLYNNKKNKAPN